MLTHRQPRTLRDRLQLAAFAMVVLVATLTGALHVAGSGSSPFKHLFGDDLVPSYMAGTFVREGRTDLLHDYAAAERYQADLRKNADLEQHRRTGPWLNPPFYAGAFVPLSAIPYRAALWTWFGLNILMLSASIVLLYRMLPADKRRPVDGVIIAAIVIVSMPALQAMACQQNTFLSLLILCVALTLARADRPFAAGAIGALLLFKPQLAVIVCGALVCTLGWRALAGMVVTAVVLIGATLLLMPGVLGDYLHKLPALLPTLRTDRPYAWERQTTFLGFWRLLLGGRTGGPNPPAVTILWLIGAIAVAAMLAVPLWKCFVTMALRRQKRMPQRHRGTEGVLSFQTHSPVSEQSGRNFFVRLALCASVPLWFPLRSGLQFGRDLFLHAFAVKPNSQDPVQRQTRDRLLAATIAASPLLMPYYMDYDLLLLAVPAVLLTAERMHTGRQRGDGWLIAGWIAVYLWMYVNAAFADATGVSVIVLLMLVRFLMPVRVFWRTEDATERRPETHEGEARVTDRAAGPVRSDGGSQIGPGRTLVPLAVAIISVCLAVAAGVLDRSSPLTFGHDFVPAYTGGRMVIEGRAADLYDVAATRAVGRAVIEDQNLTKDPSHVLWINPPAFALVYAPMALMPYRVALLVWLGLNAALATAALRAILKWITHAGLCIKTRTVCHAHADSPLSSSEDASRVGMRSADIVPFAHAHAGHTFPIGEQSTSVGMARRHGFETEPNPFQTPAVQPRAARKLALFLGVAVLVSCPFLLAVEHQQNTFVSLAILAAAVTAWRGDRPMIAGLLVGLLAYKPQLAIVVGLVLWVCEGRRALAGMLISGLALLVAGELLMPGATRDFLTKVPANAAYFQHHPGYNWGRQMTPTAFLRTLFGAGSPIATVVGHAVSVGILGLVGWIAYRLRRRRDPGRMADSDRTAAIALAFLAMPLCAPYFMDYDLLLLVIPMALLLKEGATRFVAVSGLSLWLLLYLNVDIVATTRTNVVVPALLCLVVVLVRGMSRVDSPAPAGDDNAISAFEHAPNPAAAGMALK